MFGVPNRPGSGGSSWSSAAGQRSGSSFSWGNASEQHKMFGQERMPDQIIELELTLEELCYTHNITYSISRTIEDEFKRTQVQKIPVEIPVKAGWKSGTKITFEGYGNETFLRAAANVVFVVKESPHSWAERRGDDLHVMIPITLEQALQGSSLEFKDIMTGQRKRTSFSRLSSSNETLRLPDFGMPILNSPESRGQLIIRFNIILRNEHGNN